MNRAERRRQQKLARKADRQNPPEPIVNIDAQAIFQQAIQSHNANRLDDAIPLYRKYLQLQPENQFAHSNLGVALQSTGELEGAISCYQKAIAINPEYADVHNNLAVAFLEQKRLDEASQSLQKAILLKPDYIDAYNNFGNTLKEQGKLEEAITAYQKVISLNPNYAEAYSNLGNIYKEQLKLDEAVANYKKAISYSPNLAEAYCNLGIALYAQRKLDEAYENLQKALLLKPNFAEVIMNIGTIQKEHNNLDMAVISYKKAISCDANLAEAHNNLGTTLYEQGKLDEAITSFKQAITINPSYAEAYSNLGNNYREQHRFDDAISSYQKALIIKPSCFIALQNQILTLLYDPKTNNAELFNRCKTTANEYIDSQNIERQTATEIHQEEQLIRVGYLSSDFRNHPVGQNILPLVKNHDRSKYEIICYDEFDKEDEYNRQFKKHADKWRITNNLTENQIAKMIADDGVHIMVYLAAQFDKNRYMVAVRRPAPIQVSFGSGTTTGVKEIDYWLTDKVVHPQDHTEKFIENLYYLPNVSVFPIRDGTPDIKTEPPGKKNGFITFVSFNNPVKINKSVIDLWSEILQKVPDSRLILKYKDVLKSDIIGGRIKEQFAQNGIGANQLILYAANDSYTEHMAYYENADIALDPFPFAGATTTIQAISMGVPVITLMAERSIGRLGASFMVHIGCADLVSNSKKEYVEIAVKLANDHNYLKKLRTSLRQSLLATPLSDGKKYTHNVEKAYQDMVEKYLNEVSP
ncbi:MAG: tetratricopeptide repeat protein [Magnetococcales bacterium]|nr:tetratricopeptide repeat protein [Magnetococcales bacterium]